MEGNCRTRSQVQQSLESILQASRQKELSEALAERESEYILCSECDILNDVG